MNRSAKTPQVVIAAMKDDTQFKAVEVRVQDGTAEILWARTMPCKGATWSQFAAQCGLVEDADAGRRTSPTEGDAVIGLDSTAVAFYRIKVPAISREETAAIVKMQAESLLPLPPEQIQVAWRTTPSANGKADVTIAAARCDHLEGFVDSTRDFRPRRILLSCEGMARAWQFLFAGRERQTAIVRIGERHTQICLVQTQRVVHAAVLDVGLSDLAFGDYTDPRQAPEVTERFAQDMRTIISSIDPDAADAWPIFILADGSELIDRAVASLNAVGLPAKMCRPVMQAIKAPPGLGAHDLYQYATPLGLALLAAEESADCLDLFTSIIQNPARSRTKRARYSVILAGAVAVLMLIALLATAYAVDKGRDKRYKELLAQTDLEQARQRQSLMRTVAQRRPDMLQLLTDISSGENKGIVLDGFYFKKGQAVTLNGRADNEEQMWKFQENLRKRNGLNGVEISNASQDTKTKKIKFTMTFQYRNFTKK